MRDGASATYALFLKSRLLENPCSIDEKGFAVASDRPGLGVELVEEVVKAHLKPGTQLFAPTPEWNEERSWDRLWS